MIVKTEAVVLRSMKYGETSSILTLYSREFGRISVMAKGARSPGNRFGATLQPMSHVSAVIYRYEHRDLHLLSQCDSVSRFPHLADDLDKFAAAMSVAELLEHVAREEQRNDHLFELTLSVLRAINDAASNAQNARFFFELHLADLLGFKPNFHACLSCHARLGEKNLGTKGLELRLLSGGVLCMNCSEKTGNQGTVSPGALRILQRFQEADDPEEVTRTRLDVHQTGEVRTILRQYLQNHVGGLQKLKALSVGESITGGYPSGMS